MTSFNGAHILQPHFWQHAATTLNEVLGDIQQLFKRIGANNRLPADWAAEHLQDPLEALARGIDRNLDGAEASPGDDYDTYRERTNAIYRVVHRLARLSRPALRWRESYVTLSTALGPGSRLSCLPARDPAYLFELWSFLEFAFVLLQTGRHDVLQCSALRTEERGPTFRFGGTRSVYFNYYGRRRMPLFRSKILKHAHVEWFIEDSEHPRKSVIVDTKFIQAVLDADPNAPAPELDEQSENEGPQARLVCCTDIEPKPIEWAWKGRIPFGMITLFAGDPKLGKSYATLAIAAAISQSAASRGRHSRRARQRHSSQCRGRPGSDHRSASQGRRRNDGKDPRLAVHHPDGRQ